MARLIYSAAVSLDSYIAGPGGDMSWLAGFLVAGGDGSGAVHLIDELMAQVGAMLVGRRTFDGDDPHRGDPEHEGAFEGQWEGPQFVLTHAPPTHPPEGVVFVGDLVEAIAAAKSAAGDGYVNVLGADTARQCLELGELDEVLTQIIPVMLGGGTKLFDEAESAPRLLRMTREETSNLTTTLWYSLHPD